MPALVLLILELLDRTAKAVDVLEPLPVRAIGAPLPDSLRAAVPVEDSRGREGSGEGGVGYSLISAYRLHSEYS